MANGFQADFGQYTAPVYGEQSWTDYFGMDEKYSSLFPSTRQSLLNQLDPSYYSDIISGITSQHEAGIGQEMSAIGSGLMGGIGRSKEFTAGRQQKATTPLLQQLTQGYETIEQNIGQAETQIDRNIANAMATFMGLDYEEEEGGEGDWDWEVDPIDEVCNENQYDDPVTGLCTNIPYCGEGQEWSPATLECYTPTQTPDWDAPVGGEGGDLSNPTTCEMAGGTYNWATFSCDI